MLAKACLQYSVLFVVMFTAVTVSPVVGAADETKGVSASATEKPAEKKAGPGAKAKQDVPTGMIQEPESPKQDIRLHWWGASFYGPKTVEKLYLFVKDGTVTRGGKKIGKWSQSGDRIILYANALAKEVARQYNPLSGATHPVVADKWTGMVDKRGERIDWDDGGVWGIASKAQRKRLEESMQQNESAKEK